MMRAVRYHEYGPPSVLRLEDAPEPHAPAGAVRIRTSAVSINPIDWLVRGGQLREALVLPFPIIPGRDAAGVVDEVGDGVTGVAVGDVVFGLGGTQDTCAQFAVLTAWAPVPDTWTLAQGASAGLASATALAALDVLGPIDGATILIEGAAGAVGAAAAAFAIDRGAHVLGTGRPANHDFLAGIGVVPLVYGGGLAQRVARSVPHSSPGVTAAIDTAGSGSLDELVRIAGSTQRTVTVTDADGAARLGVPLVFARNDSELMQTAGHLGARGGYVPRVAREVPMADVAEAHTSAESGSAGGKIVLTGFT